MITKGAARSPQLYCLLIGIDAYQPTTLPDQKDYPPLKGCVRDVEQFEIFFRRRLRQIHIHMQKLTAPHPPENGAPIPTYLQPTYENIIGAFQSIIQDAQKGDLVWIYYAGHGARVSTTYQEVKGQYAFDEVLVPTATDSKTVHYLRDIELGYLLKQMVDKGLIVTLVLDCCHSGGATRDGRHNPQVAIRGLSITDVMQRPIDSLVASRQVLSDNWRVIQNSRTRGYEISSGWLPQPEGYVLLAACRDVEGAFESQLHGTWHNGIFTHYLLESLQQMPQGSTYRMLYDRVRAKMYAQFGMQTPQLEGERDRVVFSHEILQQNYMVNILKVWQDPENTQQYVHLDAGQTHLLQEGAQFWIYPNPIRVQNPDEGGQRLAYAQITDLGAIQSDAQITPLKTQQIQEGDQAELIAPGPPRLSRKVRLVHNTSLRQTLHQKQVLERIATLLQQQSGAFVRLATSSETPDFLVTITNEGMYEIQYRGGKPIPYLHPVLPINRPDSAEKLVKRMVHLAKYHNVLLLENLHGDPAIVGKVRIALRRKQEDESTRWRSESGTSLILYPEEKVELVVSNDSWDNLYIAVLDLGHDWSIQQLYPKQNMTVLEPNKPSIIPLTTKLHLGYREGSDILKVFATYDPTDFTRLNLPELDQPHIPNRERGIPRNALEELLEAFHDDAPLRGNFKVVRKAEWDWTTAQVEVSIQREKSTQGH